MQIDGLRIRKDRERNERDCSDRRRLRGGFGLGERSRVEASLGVDLCLGGSLCTRDIGCA